MNPYKNKLVLFISLFGIPQVLFAEEIYQWVDEQGTHFSNVQPGVESKIISLNNVSQGKVYHWIDQADKIHISDTPPADPVIADVNEIFLAPSTPRTDPERYSAINQLKHMQEHRKNRELNRLEMKKIRLEEKRIQQEIKILRQIEFFNKHGYGPRPDFYQDDQFIYY